MSDEVKRDLDNSSQSTAWCLKDAVEKVVESLRPDEKRMACIADLPLAEARSNSANSPSVTLVLAVLTRISVLSASPGELAGLAGTASPFQVNPERSRHWKWVKFNK
jgi:hypothetical protein